MGVEPMTFSLATRRSTTELHPPFLYVVHKVGHTGENRTHIQGFAILCVTIPPRCVGSPGGSRTRRTTILSRVRIPVPSPGLKVVLYKILHKKSTTHLPHFVHISFEKQLTHHLILCGTFLNTNSNSGGKCDT